MSVRKMMNSKTNNKTSINVDFTLGVSQWSLSPLMKFLSVLCFGLLLPIQSLAEALDDAVAEDLLLSTLANALNAYAIDVAHNLNDRSVARGRIQQPRLGRFPDIPLNRMVTSAELLLWEAEFEEGAISGLALLGGDTVVEQSAASFLVAWLSASDKNRQFITFVEEDAGAAEKIASVAESYGYQILTLSGKDVSIAGNLYATTGQRLAIDSRAARSYQSDVTELSYLGERVRRNSNSLFRDGISSQLAGNEPSAFLKETLGDEFNQSTIREIIVPGGIAFGETAELPFTVIEMRYDSESLILFDEAGVKWSMPAADVKTLKALFDLVQRAEAVQSDAIVDIDADGRVRMSSAVRNTDVGLKILHADTMPFEFVPNLPVTKSVVIDTAVDWAVEDNDSLGFETEYEVRFLSADNMRIAQTRVALEYQYSSETDASTFEDSWGRDVGRLRENLDYAGLGESMGEVAQFAAWTALFRRLKTDNVSFLHGRYDFLKVNKSGETTPSRY